MPETCRGCCRSEFCGLVMNMTFVSPEQTFWKPMNVVSTKRNEDQAGNHWDHCVNSSIHLKRLQKSSASELTLDCQLPFDGVVVVVPMMWLYGSFVVLRVKCRAADPNSASCAESSSESFLINRANYTANVKKPEPLHSLLQKRGYSPAG